MAMSFSVSSKFRDFARNFSHKRFLFVLQLETGGIFINSYNVWLSLFSVICSFFVTNVILWYMNVGFYILSIFVNILLMVLALVSIKGMENGSTWKFLLGFVPTITWTIVFFSLIIIEAIYQFYFADLLSVGKIIAVLVIFLLFHVYCTGFFVLLYLEKCRDRS